MGQCVAKFGEDQYLIWSSVVDAPVTYLCSRDSMLAFLVSQDATLEDAETRISRADQHGTSMIAPVLTITDLVEYNRAGPNSTRLSSAEAIIDHYTHRPEDQSDG